MFEESETAGRSLVDRIRASACAENRAAAQTLVSIDNLYRLRLREFGGCDDWSTDTTEAVTAEVAAALRISQGLAATRLSDAIAMRRRLPNVAELFRAGDIDYLLFRELVYRTMLITDADLLDTVDAELAICVARWPSLSRGQIAGRVDRIVARHDVDAVRRRKKKADDRAVDIWDSGDGLSEIRGFLRCMDGHALNERLDALAATVCAADPRTKVQRRADAMGALADGSDRLACECGRSECSAKDKPAARPVVMYVIAEQSTVDGVTQTAGSQISSYALVPPELISELAKSAKLMPLVHPGDAPPECGYMPSPVLTDFVRCRDLTCRFPGCDEPAVGCDVDHTVAFGDGGATHASNLKCLCRRHHLLKTFWGWRDQQLRDGTVVWTSPTRNVVLPPTGDASARSFLGRREGATVEDGEGL